jgi:hypothetical protein
MSNLIKVREKSESLGRVVKAIQKVDDDSAFARVESEITYLEKIIQRNSLLEKATDDSLMLCVRSAILDNLSLDPNLGLCYVQPQPMNIGDKNNPKWVIVAEYSRSARGEISYNKQAGAILDITRPKLFKNEEGRVIGGEVDILRPSYPEPRWECFDFDESDIERWGKASEKKNKGKRNILYVNWKGGIDPEFMRAKIVKHSLKKLGANMNEGVNIEKPTPETTYTPPVEAKEEIDEPKNDEVSWDEL